MMKNFLRHMHEAGVQFRNHLYDEGYLDAVSLACPVISVGNLTMGGTGKTPVVASLVQHLQSKGLRPLIVSRSYKSEINWVSEVKPETARASFVFGDEPVLLARQLPGVPVWIGPVKYETARVAYEKYRPDVVIVDDGFQHRSLKRDLDIVLIDASKPFAEHELLPIGRGRETFSSLSRAHWIVLSKVNLSEAGTLELLRHQMPKDKKVLEMSYRARLDGDVQIDKPCFLFSGLGNPASFRRSAEQFGLQIVGEKIYPDHYRYNAKDLAEIQAKAQSHGAVQIITSEKDEIKVRDLLRVLPGVQFQFYTLKIKPEMSGPVEEFYQNVDQLFR